MDKVLVSDVLVDPEVLNHDECWSFYDWFCNESALEKRAKSMLPKLRFLVSMGILSPNQTIVWFKNNCPMDGSLYDDMRINADDKDDTFLGGFCPKTGHNRLEKKCSVWYFDTTPEKNLVELDFNDWSTFQKELKTNLDLRMKLVNAFKVERS